MNELIVIGTSEVGGAIVQTVNARALHEFLGVGKQFGNWINDRIDQYDFKLGDDYALTITKTGIRKNVIQKDYHITLDMAKDLAMVERNAKGKEARQYFIECEKRAKEASNPTALLADPYALRTALLSYSEQVIALENKVQEQAPKVAAHDALVEANNGQEMSEVAKVLGSGRGRLYNFLRELGIIKPYPSTEPYQVYVDRGWFKLQERTWYDKIHRLRKAYSKTLITGKGVIGIQKLWAKHGDTAVEKPIAKPIAA